MPVSKKGSANVKPSKVAEVDPDEIEEDDDPEEEELDEPDDDDDSEGDDEGVNYNTPPTSAPPRGRGRPRGANNPGIPWDEPKDVKDAALIKTMRRIVSGRLSGPLTPAVVVAHLKSHEAFAGVERLLTPAAVAARAKNRAKALAKAGVEIPTFPVKLKPNIATLAALLEDDEDE